MEIDYIVNNETINNQLIEVRSRSGMSRKEFAEYFDIPYRTMQDWELGNRKMPEYLFRLMQYKLHNEDVI